MATVMAERQHRAGDADRAERADSDVDEAREHLQRDVAGQHVGEETNGQADRPRQERDHLDQHDQRHQDARHALRHEQLQEAEAVLHEAVDDDRADHQQRQREGDDDVAGDGEEIGEQAEQVGDQHEHEQREHQREELHALRAGRVAQHRGDELVGHFGDRLQARRDQRRGSTCEDTGTRRRRPRSPP